jgi:hypothetical protein
MTQATLHATPAMRVVLREQIRALAIALRTPSLIALAMAAVASALAIAEFATGGGPVDFAPELSMLPGMLGAVFPVVVWKREERVGAGFLWTLPVNRRHHALARVSAGWVWLMVAIAVFVVWLLVLALFTGGNFFGEQTLRLLPSAAPEGTLSPDALHSVRYSPSPLFWLVPFTAGTGTYVLASAVALGTRHPLRWLIGVILMLLLLSVVGSATHVERLRFLPSVLVHLVHEGPYGLDALLTARAESLKTIVVLSDGTRASVWRGLPDVGAWAIATVLWTGTGLVGVWAASLRHAENRR